MLFPIIVVTLYGDVSECTLVAKARDIRDELDGLQGILEVDISVHHLFPQRLTDQLFDIVMSGEGVIALDGIVVNNNIRLIDTYKLLRLGGMDALDAVIRTGAQRVPPVILTTSTTALGLMPMVLGFNIDTLGRKIRVGGPSTQW